MLQNQTASVVSTLSVRPKVNQIRSLGANSEKQPDLKLEWLRSPGGATKSRCHFFCFQVLLFFRSLFFAYFMSFELKYVFLEIYLINLQREQATKTRIEKLVRLKSILGLSMEGKFQICIKGLFDHRIMDLRGIGKVSRGAAKSRADLSTNEPTNVKVSRGGDQTQRWTLGRRSHCIHGASGICIMHHMYIHDASCIFMMHHESS